MKNIMKNNITKSIIIAIMIAIAFVSCTKEEYYPQGPTNHTIEISKQDTIITSTYSIPNTYITDLTETILFDTTIHNVIDWSLKATDNPQLKVEYTHFVTETSRYQLIYDNYKKIYYVGAKLKVIEQTYVDDTTSKQVIHNMTYTFNEVVNRRDFDNIFNYNQPNCSQGDVLFYPYYNLTSPYMYVEIYYDYMPGQYSHTDICYNENIVETLRQKIEQGQHKIENQML